MNKETIFLVQQLNSEILSCLMDETPLDLLHEKVLSYEELYAFLDSLIDNHLASYNLDFSQREIQKYKKQQIESYIAEAKIPFSSPDGEDSLFLYLPPIDSYKQKDTFSNPTVHTPKPVETRQVTEPQLEPFTSTRQRRNTQVPLPSSSKNKFELFLKWIKRYVKQNKMKTSLFAAGLFIVILLLTLLGENSPSTNTPDDSDQTTIINNTYHQHIERANKAIEKKDYKVAEKELQKAKKIKPVTAKEEKERVPLEKKIASTIKKQNEDVKEKITNVVAQKEKPLTQTKETASENTNISKDEKTEEKEIVEDTNTEDTNTEVENSPSTENSTDNSSSDEKEDNQQEKIDVSDENSKETKENTDTDQETTSNEEQESSDTLSTNGSTDEKSLSFLEKTKNFFIVIWNFIASIFKSIYAFLLIIWTFISNLFTQA